jgi:hypothetical protein
MSHSVIVKGKAFIFPGETSAEGLRCKARITLTRLNNKTNTREEYETSCNRLLAKPNRDGEISGELKCQCGQIVEVTANTES